MIHQALGRGSAIYGIFWIHHPLSIWTKGLLQVLLQGVRRLVQHLSLARWRAQSPRSTVYAGESTHVATFRISLSLDLSVPLSLSAFLS